MQIKKNVSIEEKIIEIRSQKVLLDSDIAEFYGVETKHINQAVKNNSIKFPQGYVLELSHAEWQTLKSKFLTSNELRGGKTKRPKAFTEKGLYMLATILKSPQAAETSIAIIETYAKLREVTQSIGQLSTIQDEKQKQGLLKRSGTLITELFDNSSIKNESETTIEINFAVLKLKHTIKKGK